AGWSLVGAGAYRVALGGVRDERWLLGIIARLAHRGVLFRREWIGRPFLVERRRPAQGREGLRRGERRQQRDAEGGGKQAQIAGHGHAPVTRSIFTAHFLKSVCS